MKKLPESVKKDLIAFLVGLPVDKLSKDWEAIQVAISMITTPSSFKKGLHVYLGSCDDAREPGCYNINEISIKIWPYKIQMRRKHSEYVSGSDININQTFRYIYPSDKYCAENFYEVMSEMGQCAFRNFSQCKSTYSGNYSIESKYNIETNVK